MKKALLKFMRVSGAFATFRLANRGKVLILMYHRFSNQNDGEATSAHAFREQLTYLTSHYRIVPLSSIAELIKRGETIPPGLAVITIDDGYRDVYDIAFPILREFQVPATLFLVTDFIEEKAWLWTDKLKFITQQTKSRWLEVVFDNLLTRIELDDYGSRRQAAYYINAILKKQPNTLKEQTITKIAAAHGVDLPAQATEQFQPLSWDEVRELDAEGIEIGSHTVSHPILTQIDNQQLRYELHESKLHLEARLHRNVDLFCYPNGDCNEEIAREVKRAGYRCAVTTNYGLNYSAIELLKLRRIAAESNFSRFLQSTSGFEETKQRLRNAGQFLNLKRATANQL